MAKHVLPEQRVSEMDCCESCIITTFACCCLSFSTSLQWPEQDSINPWQDSLLVYWFWIRNMVDKKIDRKWISNYDGKQWTIWVIFKVRIMFFQPLKCDHLLVSFLLFFYDSKLKTEHILRCHRGHWEHLFYYFLTLYRPNNESRKELMMKTIAFCSPSWFLAFSHIVYSIYCVITIKH